MGHSQHVTSSTISLLLANQVEDILNGRDDQFKGKETSQPDPGAATPASRPKPVKPASIVPAMPNSSHLDAVPQATPINRNRVIHKKVRTFPLCFDDTDPPAVHENAAQPELLVPIRLDMDIEGGISNFIEKDSRFFDFKFSKNMYTIRPKIARHFPME